MIKKEFINNELKERGVKANSKYGKALAEQGKKGMTVADLIKSLQDCSQDAPVLLSIAHEVKNDFTTSYCELAFEVCDMSNDLNEFPRVELVAVTPDIFEEWKKATDYENAE